MKLTRPWARVLGPAMAVTAASLLLAASAGSAVQLERERVTIDGDDTVEDFCGDILMHGTFHIDGFIRVAERGDGFAYFADSWRTREVLTNVENGRAMTLHTVQHNRDAKVESNGDGTVTVIVREARMIQVRTEDGRLFDLTAGTTTYELLLSEEGTPDDPFDDVLIGEPVVRGFVGHQPDSEFCDAVHELIG